MTDGMKEVIGNLLGEMETDYILLVSKMISYHQILQVLLRRRTDFMEDITKCKSSWFIVVNVFLLIQFGE